MTLFDETKTGGLCIFSKDRAYRYWLEREWDAALPRLGFVMLNPSTADEEKNDPTIERCERRAVKLGYGTLVVVNLFALRATDPNELYRHPRPISEDATGEINDKAILKARSYCDKLILGWGVHGEHRRRGFEVHKMLDFTMSSFPVARNVFHIGRTKDGHPRHPLYVPYSAKLEPLEPVLW